MLRKNNKFSKPQLAIFVLAFAMIGYLIFKSFAASNPNLPGDLNNDNTVNAQDLSLLLSNYGTTNSAGDVDGNGTVNAVDLSVLLSHYGQSVSPAPTVSLSANPLTISSGQSSTLTWSSSNATSCTASGAWTGSKSLSGSSSTGALNQTSTYTLTCVNSANQSAVSSATVTVSGASSQPSFPITAAFYYPWYDQSWTAHYQPSLGYYISSDQATQQAHIRAMDYAHIKAAISSWYGPSPDVRDVNLKSLMSQTLSMGSNLKWCVYYEKEGFETLTSTQIAADLAYIRDNLATSPAYLKVNGKFVVFVYSPGNYNGLDGTGDALVKRYLSANSMVGNSAYIDLKVYNYYQSTPDQPDSWHQYYPASPESTFTATGNQSMSISPGFWGPNDATPQLLRDPNRWLTNASDLASSTAPWKLITTFNEWYESTSVESSPTWASSSGYGTYLDVLHNKL